MPLLRTALFIINETVHDMEAIEFYYIKLQYISLNMKSVILSSSPFDSFFICKEPGSDPVNEATLRNSENLVLVNITCKCRLLSEFICNFHKKNIRPPTLIVFYICNAQRVLAFIRFEK